MQKIADPPHIVTKETKKKEEEFDPCGNPVKKKEAPLKLSTEERAERLKWAKESCKTTVDTQLYNSTRHAEDRQRGPHISSSLHKRII